MYYCLIILFLVVTVEFSKSEFTGSEASGFVPVEIILSNELSGGTISASIRITECSPISATGMCCTLLIFRCTSIYYSCDTLFSYLYTLPLCMHDKLVCFY